MRIYRRSAALTFARQDSDTPPDLHIQDHQSNPLLQASWPSLTMRAVLQPLLVFLFLCRSARSRERWSCLAWPQEDELEVRAAKISQLGQQVASEGRQRAEERRGRTEAERRLRAEKQVSTVPLRLT